MTKQTINIGTTSNDGTGDTLRTSFRKTNNNFSELYNTTANTDANLTILSISVDAFEGEIFTLSEAAFDVANAAYQFSNNQYVAMNAAYTLANTVNNNYQGAVTNADAAYALANSFSIKINSNYTTTNSAFRVANAAFNFANSLPLAAAATLAGAAFDQANLSYIYASASFESSNASYAYAYGLSANVVSTRNFANGVSTNTTAAYRVANSGYVVTNASFQTTNAVYFLTNSAFVKTNASFTVANASYDTLNVAYSYTNSAFNRTNSCYTVTNSAFGRANTALQNTTGTFAGSLTVAGSLTATGTVTAPNVITNSFYSPGLIIQVIQVVKTSAFTTTSTSPVDVPGLIASITPKYASSKILVIVSLSWTTSGHSDAYLIRNTSTKLFVGDAYGVQTQASLHAYGEAYGQAYGHISFLDSPATTSATTYKIQVASPHTGYTIGVNYPWPNQNGNYNSRTPSSITLMEVAQ